MKHVPCVGDTSQASLTHEVVVDVTRQATEFQVTMVRLNKPTQQMYKMTTDLNLQQGFTQSNVNLGLILNPT